MLQISIFSPLDNNYYYTIYLLLDLAIITLTKKNITQLNAIIKPFMNNNGIVSRIKRSYPNLVSKNITIL